MDHAGKGKKLFGHQMVRLGRDGRGGRKNFPLAQVVDVQTPVNKDHQAPAGNRINEFRLELVDGDDIKVGAAVAEPFGGANACAIVSAEGVAVPDNQDIVQRLRSSTICPEPSTT